MSFTIGQKVKYIGKDAGLSLTYGKIYEVVGLSEFDSDPIVINDLKNRQMYFSWRFEAISIEEEIKLITNLSEIDSLLHGLAKGYELYTVQCDDGSGHIEIHKETGLYAQIGAAKGRLFSSHWGRFAENHKESKLKSFKEALLWLAEKQGKLGHQQGDIVEVNIDSKKYRVEILEKVGA